MSTCKYCGEEIGWRKDGEKNIPVNADGSLHRNTCKSNQKPAAGAIIGLLTGYNSTSATFRVKGGATKTYALQHSTFTAWQTAGFGPDHWIEFTIDAQSFIQPGARNIAAPEWAAELKDPTGGEIKKPGELPKQETLCTSPAAASPQEKPKFTAADLFSPKDRLIVVQVLIKAYSELWCSCNTPDTVTFADARKEILAAVEEDLQQVMKAGA